MSLTEVPALRSVWRRTSDTIWNTELEKILCEKLAEKKSASVIAAEMREHGIAPTRNAIIGKVHRMGAKFESAIQAIKPARDHGSGAVRSIQRRIIIGNNPPPKETPPQVPFLGIALAELQPNQCHYPRGENPILFCGQPKGEDSSYCAHCHAIAHISVP